MKKITITAICAAMALAVATTSCGAMGGATAQQPTSQSSNQGGGLLGSVLGTLIGSALPLSYESMAGTWVYSSPEVRFESENALAQAGGMVAASEVEQKLAEAYAKVGLKPGAGSFTFTADKTCVIDFAGRKISGTYTINSSDHSFSFKSTTGLIKINGKVYYTGKSLAIIFDAKKLLSITQALGAISGQAGTIGAVANLLGNYDGLMLGMNLTK